VDRIALDDSPRRSWVADPARVVQLERLAEAKTW